jgi:glycosyltransferase involved in cell wall biosynthesis
MRVSLVFITKNEVVGLKSILPEIDLRQFEQVYAIDAHSNDGTAELFAEYGIPVHAQTARGLGAATLEARQHCHTDAMIFFHPDGNENHHDLFKFVEHLNLNYDFVIASRMIKGSFNEDDRNLFKWRKWANLGFALISNTIFGTRRYHVSDVVQGFRAITCEAFDRLYLDQTNCTIDYQMVIRALKVRLKIAEFPTIEGERIAGATNFASLPTGIAELKMLWREIVLGNSPVKQPAPRAELNPVSKL